MVYDSLTNCNLVIDDLSFYGASYKVLYIIDVSTGVIKHQLLRLGAQPLKIIFILQENMLL